MELDCSDIVEIFKNHLKIENSVKSITHTFMNPRYASRIDYAPYFQRKYVWNDEKATYFIESILLGTEIPPIVLFENGRNNEVIDGRQRYETIKRFLENGLALSKEGLKSLSLYAGLRYMELPIETRNNFINTKIRILQFSIVNEPTLSVEREDKVKKEIFARYNSGIIALKSHEIERAAYIGDQFVQSFKDKLEKDSVFLKQCQVVLMPRGKQSMSERDRINYVMSRARNVLAMKFIPIQSYASASSKSDVIHSFYSIEVLKRTPQENMKQFVKVMDKLSDVRKIMIYLEDQFLKDNNHFYEALFWGLLILEESDLELFNKIDIIKMANDFHKCADIEVFWDNITVDKRGPEMVFFATGSHYYKSIINRYLFMSNYIFSITGVDFSQKIRNKTYYNSIMSDEKKEEQYRAFKLSKTDPVSATVYDILSDVKNSNFIIRPDYQRSEVPNAIQKASYLMESILLGIKIPPIFIYRKKNSVSEVIDGQQRLLSILGFLRESYKDVGGVERLSDKNDYKLSKLRFLKELNGKNIDGIEEIDRKYKDRILDFQIDIVEINEDQNPNFDPIDLFLRLNSKPFPIEPNTFEMWNAYVTKEYVEEIKGIASKYAAGLFRAQDPRMKNEELITVLAYLAYQERKNSQNPGDSLNIFVKNQRINARIKDKTAITNTLGEISRSNDSVFGDAINDVVDFVKKLGILTGQNFENFNKLIAHHKRSRTSRTNQNFYLLWIAVAHIDIERLIEKNDLIFDEIHKMLVTSQNIPDENFDIEEYVSSLFCI